MDVENREGRKIGNTRLAQYASDAQYRQTHRNTPWNNTRHSAIQQTLFLVTSWFLEGSESGVDQGPLMVILD